jgi:uncharacterized protein YbjT (DUF2867 family)
MNVLVIGGTGMVGSQVVRGLLARGESVRVLTRNADKAKGLPAGATHAAGDLLDPKTVRTVFEGVDGVFLLNAVSATECHEGLMAVNGARMARVKKIVYLSVHDVHLAPHLPHFGAKLPIEMAIKASGIAYTIVRPNNFYQNDYWLKDAILQYGVYPQPIGSVGMSRVDVRDISEASVAALTSSEHHGQTYDLVGPEVLTGPSSAEVWSRALGRTIRYAGDDLDAWEQQMLQFMPAWMVFDYKHMFAFFQKNGLKAAPGTVEKLTKVLGHAPRRYEDFVAETARMWASS